MTSASSGRSPGGFVPALRNALSGSRRLGRRPSRRRSHHPAAAGTTVLVAALALTSCSGARVDGAGGSSGSASEGDTAARTGASSSAACGSFDLAVNPWVGYEASAAVVKHVAEERLGCDVATKNLKEEVSWQGFDTGEVDVIIENWGHEDLKKKYVTGQKTAVVVGPNGNKGIIGWYVPPWMAAKYPDILDYKNLNKYADMLKTSESKGKGQLLDGDPSFVTNDAALVKNLKLNYEVVYAGSEAALITSFRQAEKQKKPLLGYFYAPQWFLAEVPLKKVALPTYTPGCDADAEKVACDYPVYELDKIVSADFAKTGGPAYDLVKKFSWTNDDQNVVAKYIAQDKMTPDAAAKKWVDENPDKVEAWLAG
jgi:glycine betaine/proline transport system substrate-binding protein